MTDDAIIIDAISARLVDVRPGGEVWRVATRSRTGRVIPLPTARRADPIDPSTGYRRVRLGKYRSAVAHRIVWIATHGPIAPGLEINHRNRDKADNRIDNLEAITHLQNVRHAYVNGGVPQLNGERNGRSKLTEHQVAEARARASAGETHRSIGESMGVSKTAIGLIVRRVNWRHAAIPEVPRG